MRRLTGTTLATVLLAIAAALGPAPAGALDEASSLGASPEGGVLPSSARPGERVTVWSTGWPAGVQVQGVVCGDEAVGGSQACDLPRAAVARTEEDGALALGLVVSAPPRPCPCVVRLSAFDGPALSLNVPIHVIGHRAGAPPAPRQPAADLRLGAIRFEDGGGLRALLGLGGPTRMIVSVVNAGDAPGAVPALAYGFGGAEPDLDERTVPDLEVPPGQRREVVLDVVRPLVALGAVEGAVQWADGSGPVASAQTTTRPWGLLTLVALLGVVALGTLFWVRLRRRRQAPTEGSGAAPPYPLPDVVYLSDLQAFVVHPRALRFTLAGRRVGGRLTTGDLALLARAASVAAPGPATTTETISLLTEDDRELDDATPR